MSEDIRHTLALMLISAAYADGKIHPREEKIIRLGLGTDSYKAALAAYENADEEQRENMQKEVASKLQDRSAREKALGLLRRLFMADGNYAPAENQWMRDVWRQLSG